MSAGHEPSSSALVCHAVTSGYGDITIVRDVSLAVPRGGVMTVLGKNGMGKTTLLKTIMGFLVPTGGRIELFGEDATGKEPQWLVERGVAYVPQDEAIFQDLTVEDNLRLGVRADHLLKQGMPRIAEFFPVITERLRQRAGTLSGGEQKMLLMSRALVSNPALLIVDEISEGLQPSMVLTIIEILKRLASQEGTSVLMAEQNIRLVSRVSDAVALIDTGRVAETRALIGEHKEEDLLELMRL